MGQFLLLGTAFASYLYIHDSDLAFADEKKGAAENKVRFFGNPRDIFETFATEKDDEGNPLMSYADFWRAITPWTDSNP